MKTPVPRVVKGGHRRVFDEGSLLRLSDGQMVVIEGCPVSGGFGDVYPVSRCSDRARFALKVFRGFEDSRFDGSPEVDQEIKDKYRQLFCHESRNLREMAEVSPENFPRFVGEGEVDGRPYYLMEMLDRVTGETLLRFKTDDERKRFIYDVCDAVSALHLRGFVHFDIKPENILCRREKKTPRYVLGDLGTVHRVESHDAMTNPNSVNVLSDGRHLQARTLGFKDPMDDKYTIHADIYAIGQVIRSLFREDVPFLWGQIILNCISNDFRYRYESVAALKADVRLMESQGPQLLSRALTELVRPDGIVWSVDRNRIYVSADAKSPGDGSEGRPFGTVSEGLRAAGDNDVVLVSPGEYTENLVLEGKKVMLIGERGARKTVLRAAERFKSVITFDKGSDGSLVCGFTITGGVGNPTVSSYGHDYYGGGANCRVSCTIRDCIVTKNGMGEPKKSACTFGGGVYVTSGTVNIENCRIDGNFAWASGGGVLVDGAGAAAIMTDCTVRNNDSTSWSFGHQGGIGLANEGVLAISKSMVYRNGGDQIGAFGAVYAKGTRASVENCYIENDARACGISLFLSHNTNYKTLSAARGKCGCVL